MPIRFRERLHFLVATPGRAVVSLLGLAVLLAVAWFGVNALRFSRNREAAKLALTAYDFSEARQRLQTCLRIRPRDPETLLLAVQVFRREGLLDEAQTCLDRYRDQMEEPTPESALQGVLMLVQRGKVKENVYPLLEYVEVRHPASEQILEALAVGSVRVYRLDEAKFFINQLLDRFPDNPIARLLDAQTDETMRRRESTMEKMRKLVEDYPNFDKARLYFADRLFARHKYNEAIENYQRVYERRPDDVMALVGLIRSLLTLERLEEAEPLLRELEEKHGDDTESLLQRARYALRRKRPEQAEPLLRRALELTPQDHEIHRELAVCLNQLNRLDESREHLERHKQMQHDLMQLEKVFEQMVKSPADPEPRLRAGQICLRNGQLVEGLRWLDGALELAPDHKPTHQALAEHYESLGDTVQAEYHRKKAH